MFILIKFKETYNQNRHYPVKHIEDINENNYTVWDKMGLNVMFCRNIHKLCRILQNNIFNVPLKWWFTLPYKEVREKTFPLFNGKEVSTRKRRGGKR